MSRTQRFKVRVDGVEHDVDVASSPDAPFTSVVVNGRLYEVVNGPDDMMSVRCVEAASDATQFSVWLDPDAVPRSAQTAGQVYALDIETAQQAALREALSQSGHAGGGGAVVKAPMPGRVVRVLVQPGDDIALDDPLVIVEAMKMENEVRATAPGRVDDVAVSVGDTVDAGQRLCAIVPHAEAS